MTFKFLKVDNTLGMLSTILMNKPHPSKFFYFNSNILIIKFYIYNIK